MPPIPENMSELIEQEAPAVRPVTPKARGTQISLYLTCRVSFFDCAVAAAAADRSPVRPYK